MICEILSIGTELLLGHVVNTNANYIARKLAESGIDCFYQTSVGDNLERASSAIEHALKRSDIVVITGGLGSTDDDLTRQAISGATGKKLNLDSNLKELIRQRLVAYQAPVTDRTLSQAFLPEGAVAITPTIGTAPGIILSYKGKTLVSLPGVPQEMRHMLDTRVIPYLKEAYAQPNRVILSRQLKIYGLREVEVEDKLGDLIKKQTNPTIAPLLGLGEVILRVTAKSDSVSLASDLIADTESDIRSRIGEYVYAADDDEMEDVVGLAIVQQHLTLVCAESITGGLITSRLVNHPGSSQYIVGSVVAYSNSLKTRLLDVSPKTLLAHGAVSQYVAEEMANGARQRLGADIGISTTGIAGPDGGTKAKPVGLVYFGLSAKNTMINDHQVFIGTRNEIRWKASQYALNMLRLYLIERGRGGEETA